MPDNCSHFLVQESMALTRAGVAPTECVAAAGLRMPPAYLCFTPGSIGKPEAVVCTHQALIVFQSNAEVRLHVAPSV